MGQHYAQGPRLALPTREICCLEERLIIISHFKASVYLYFSVKRPACTEKIDRCKFDCCKVPDCQISQKIAPPFLRIN